MRSQALHILLIAMKCKKKKKKNLREKIITEESKETIKRPV